MSICYYLFLSVKGLGGGSTDDGMKIIIIIIITFHLCHASYYQLLTIYIAESSDTEVITDVSHVWWGNRFIFLPRV